MLKNLFVKIKLRKFEIILGIFWIIDGLLELQPKLLTTKLAISVIKPMALGQPLILKDLILNVSHIIINHPLFYGLIFGLIQISIGLLIIFKKSNRLGIYISIFWGILVWIIGEGLAGLLTNHSYLEVGAPGAVLLYVIFGFVLLFKNRSMSQKIIIYIWAIIWILGAILLLKNSQGSLKVYLETLQSNLVYTPIWLININSSLIKVISLFGNWSIIYISGIYLAIGILALFSLKLLKISLILGIILALIIWFVGEDLGGFYTGIMTDPNSAPLIILLASYIFPYKIRTNKTKLLHGKHKLFIMKLT